MQTAKTLRSLLVLLPLALALGFLVSSCKGETLFDEYPELASEVDLVKLDNKTWDMSILSDYKAYEGRWWLDNANERLNFQWWNSSGVESKFEFLDTTMADGKVEMDLTLTGVRLNAGTIGFLLRSGEYGNGQDNVSGYYIAVGRDNAGQHHIEAGRMQHGWTPIWPRAKIEGNGTFHLSVEMVGYKFNVVVTNKGKTVLERSFYDYQLPYGNVGLRSWQGIGYVDNVKITNVGPGYDFAK